MIIRIVLISTILLSLVAGYFFLKLAPYHFYHISLTEGIKSDYISLVYQEPPILQGKVKKPLDNFEDDKYYQSLWKNFHFSDYVVSFPTHHPEIILIPFIKDFQANKAMFGGKYLNQKGQEVFEFIEERTLPFKLLMDEEKLFSLPIVKNQILSKNSEEIWYDLFIRDLNLEFGREPSVVEFYKQSKKYSLEELAYNLFIIHMRLSYFGVKGIAASSFINSKKFGLVEVHDVDDRYLREYVYILNNGVIHKLQIRSLKWDPLAESTRERFLANLEFRPTREDSSISIYSDYKRLNYTKRIGQEGMVYLYSALTHTIEQEKFLKEMIRFLERGRDNQAYLNPLYEYASKRFGTDFLGNSEQALKLQRKIEEEAMKEQEDAKNAHFEERNEFTNPEEKIQFLLNNAKESGINTDKDENVLER